MNIIGLAPSILGVLYAFSVRILSRRLCVAVVASLVWVNAQAVTGGITVVTPFGPATSYTTANSARLIYGTANSSLSVAQAGSLARAYGLDAGAGVGVSDVASMRLGGQVLNVTAKRIVAAALLPEIAVAVTVVTVGSAIYDYYNAAGIQRAPDGGFQARTGNTVPTSSGWAHNLAVTTNYGTTGAACSAYSAAVVGLNGGALTAGSVSVQPVDENNANCRATFTNAEGQQLVMTGGLARSQLTACYDPVTGAITNLTVGNVCNPGTYVPTTEAQAKQKLSQVTAPNPAGVVKQAVEAGVKPEAGPMSLTGPATSQTPKVTTTTGPSGTTTTTTTNNYQYDGDTVTYNTTNVTNVTNNAGDIISTTTTTDSKPEDERTDCEKNPDTVGCAELDTPDGEIPTASKDLTFTPEDVLGEGSCPADAFVTLHALGGQPAKVADWTTMCAQALPIRAFVMALAALTAFMILMPGGGAASGGD